MKLWDPEGVDLKQTKITLFPRASNFLPLIKGTFLFPIPFREWFGAFTLFVRFPMGGELELLNLGPGWGTTRGCASKEIESLCGSNFNLTFTKIGVFNLPPFGNKNGGASFGDGAPAFLG